MRPEKISIVAEIRAQLDGAKFAVLMDYRGLTVEQLYELRGRLRESDSSLFVVKNSFLKIAGDNLKLEEISGFLGTPTAVVAGRGDIAQTTKILTAFAGEHNLPILKGGLLGDQVLSAEDFEEIAKIPPRAVLLSQVVGTIASPMSGLVGVLNQKLCSLLYVLKAAAEKKGGGLTQAS